MNLDALIPDLPPFELGFWGGLVLGVAFLGLGVAAFATRHKFVGALALIIGAFGFYQMFAAWSPSAGGAG